MCCLRSEGGGGGAFLGGGVGGEYFDDGVGGRGGGGLFEDEFADPECEGVVEEGVGYLEGLGEVGVGAGYWGGGVVGGGGLEGVDDGGLPCLDFFGDGAVFEVEGDAYLAEGVEPG